MNQLKNEIKTAVKNPGKVKETEELIKYAEETNETPVVEKSEEVEATEAEAPVEAEN